MVSTGRPDRDPPPVARSPVSSGHPVSPVVRSVRSPGQGKWTLTDQDKKGLTRPDNLADLTGQPGRPDRADRLT